jgi:hypothetical protein
VSLPTPPLRTRVRDFLLDGSFVDVVAALPRPPLAHHAAAEPAGRGEVLSDGKAEVVCGINRCVSTALTHALAHESQRHRAEELVALDSAKTRFFQNVGHSCARR